MTGLHAGAATDVGKVRSNNQDQFLVAPPLYAVADGMGGHAAGEVASRVAVEAFRAAFEVAAQGTGPRSESGTAATAPDDATATAPDDVAAAGEAATGVEKSPSDGEADATPVPRGPGADVLVGAVLQANRAVWERAQQEPSFRGMGTTLVGLGLVVENDQEVVGLVNVGDSRIYLLRNDELQQLTTDHSLVQELVDDGQLTEAEAGLHPQRHVLTRALGVDHDVEVDLIEVIPYTGDRFLLCSDGLSREVSDNQIASILRRLADPDEAAKELVAEARAHGGNDNITVVVVDVVDDDDRAGRASAALAVDRTSTSRTDAVREPEQSPEDEGPAPATAAKVTAKKAKPRAERRTFLTPRVVLFGVVVLLLLAGGAAAVVYYARGSYFVGVQGDRLTIYRGRPGGVLWFDPTVEQKTGVTTSQVLPSRVPDLKTGKEEPSLTDARQYVHNLQAEGAAHGVGAAPAPTSTTAAGPASATTSAPGSPGTTTATPPTAPTGVSP
jgi:PPM family protein phosphatase